MTPPYPQQPKTSGLAITSLVFGILSLICFGLLAGLPAIIFGHIARGKINRSAGTLTGGGLALTGLILGYLSIFTTFILIALALPAVSGAMKMGQATQELNNARQIDLAIQAMAADGASTGKKELGYPADAGYTTSAELKQALINGGYLTAEDAAHLRFDDFVIGNVSGTDADDTILLRSNPEKSLSHLLVVFRKGGDGNIVHSGNSPQGSDPARDPAYLAP